MPAASPAEQDARFILTRRYLGAVLGDAPDADVPARVNARFSGGLIVDRAARDLARYESERARLARAPALARPREPLPANDVPLKLSPEIALITFGADLPGMLDALRAEKPAAPRPARGWILLLPRGEGHIDERLLTRDEEGWFLEWFREPTTIDEVWAMVEERAPFEAIWTQGLLTRA